MYLVKVKLSTEPFVLWEKVELKHNYSVLFLVKLWLKVAGGAGLEHKILLCICLIIRKADKLEQLYSLSNYVY